MKWLISCFEPFNGAATNSSIQILEPIRQMDWQGRVEFLSPLPVGFKRSWATLRAALKDPNIGGVLALGQAEGRERLSLERVACNWIQPAILDNFGVKPVPTFIEPDGPDLLWSPIPWSKMSLSPNCTLSYSAGTFVCNEILYYLARWAERQKTYAGFVHVPLLQGDMSPTHPMVVALCDVLRFTLNLKKRIQVVAGIIENSRGLILLARRPEGKHLAGLWEFPGGKVEVGERHEAALHRELQEELNLNITIKKDLGEFAFEYDQNAIGLRVFVVQAESEPKRTADVQEFKWLRLDQVNSQTLVPADREPFYTYLQAQT